MAARLVRDPLAFSDRLRRRYGDLFTVRLPAFGTMVYVADPVLVKEIFSGDPKRFHTGRANALALEPLLGSSSVLTLDGAAHMRQRRVLLPPFHGESIARYGEIIGSVANRDIDTWPVGEPFALRPHTQAITLEVILRAVFGIEDPAGLDRAARAVEELGAHASLVLAFPQSRRDLGRFSPWVRFKRARAALDAIVHEAIAARRADPRADERDDVLSLLLRARHEDDSPMSDSELRDELVTVIAAGYETTATALAWAVERLVRTPRVYACLRASIAAGEQDYLDATIKETLRMRPVLVDVARVSTAPIELGGYEIPAGQLIMPSISAVHQRDDVFPDPREFRPERFLEGEGDDYGWIPFGGGVRRCVGAAFAQYEMRIVLKAIVERTELRAPRRAWERPRLRHITVAPARGTRIELVKRA